MSLYKNIDERTKILNNDANKRPVLDSIDRPIRPLVMELNRIGLVTVFSCCGFTYKNQEEPKSHQEGWPYVLFLVDKKNNQVVKNFFRLAEIAPNFGWFIHIQENGVEWSISNRNQDIWMKCDNLDEPIHQYELKLICIRKITEAIQNIPSLNDAFMLRDGNELRTAKYGEEWIVEPKQPMEIKSSDIKIIAKTPTHTEAGQC